MGLFGFWILYNRFPAFSTDIFAFPVARTKKNCILKGEAGEEDMQMEVFWERPAQGGQSEPIARFLSEQGLLLGQRCPGDCQPARERTDSGLRRTGRQRHQDRGRGPGLSGAGIGRGFDDGAPAGGLFQGTPAALYIYQAQQRAALPESQLFPGGCLWRGHAAGEHPGDCAGTWMRCPSTEEIAAPW